ncbi:hypothetical protein JL720_1635 [Aureococcus anophagefferens]|nr:hypothetical protein JL720_1635 [Aureococcus anophagefferens]
MLLDEAPAYSDAEVIWNATQILGAGYDTTSNTLAFTTLLLASRPELQRALRDEVTAAAPAGAVGADDVAKLPLLNAVLKESMRLYPGAPFLGRLYEKDEAFAYGGATFERNASALVSPYLLGRNAQRAREPRAWLPFGFGARGCVGMKLAMIEAKLLLAGVVADFHMELARARAPSPTPSSLTLSNAGGVHLALTPV